MEGFTCFFRPIYIPIDLEIIKSILVKDFGHFVNHGVYVNEQVDPLTGNLFNLEDGKWKNLRTKLTPAFTSGKLKMMFQTMLACSAGLENILDEYSTTGHAVDIKEILSRFTIDVIGSCAFGIDCDSLKNPESEFKTFTMKVFNRSLFTTVRQFVILLIPRHVLVKLRFKLTRRDIESFFINTVRETVEYREKHQIFRKDFMHLLLQGAVSDDEKFLAKDEEAKKDGRLSLNEIAAQCFVFFLAGFETSATTVTFALLELALNEDVQEKLRAEIQDVLEKHGEITYEAVMEMSYLDKVINENIPPFPGTPRVCTKTYRVPGTSVVIEPGTRVHIPIFGIQTDPEYYPEPDVFDPERFNEENKAKRPAFAYIPFGEGPRICIGARFGLTQSKVGLVTILRRFRVTLNEKTKTPIEHGTKTFVLEVKGGVWLNITKSIMYIFDISFQDYSLKKLNI
ncbi:hypothetical protein NQ318_010666 [Aromia moschata]|uniref:Cytochrome P450 n=1 Tax=Aromia moschata TaxID=1265417 RepID=A0AAV8XSN6_9CUCU|nr:hypothetical protein NQ318_010666 [Aromia moschata]